MNSVSSLGPSPQPLSRSVQILRALIDQFDVYRRYIRAGSEIEALLALSDHQLAARGLKRTEIGRAILEKHGIGFGRSPVSERRSIGPGARTREAR